MITFSETFCTRNLARAALSVAVMTLATPYRGAGVPGAPPPDPEVARFAVTLKYSRWRERAGIFLPLAFVGGLNVLPLAASPSRPHIAPVGRASVKARRVSASDFPARGQSPSTLAIGVVPGRIITEAIPVTLPFADGLRSVDLSQDLAKVAVVARHGINDNIGVAFVRGFGVKRGAIACSVGHDSHNITVVGADEADMAAAVNRLIEIEGGFAVASDGEIRAELSLPVAGLMSLLSFEEVRAALIPLRAAAKGLGVVLPEPFLQVAFLPLPVIPHLKITDRGLVDVDRMEFVRD